MGWLRLTIEQDDDGTAELFAQFEANGFAGRGSAWVDLIALKNLAAGFGKYPLETSDRPCIEGGYWGREGTGKLDQEHLHISAYPIGSRGELGVRVRAATPFQHEDERRSQHLASVELRVTYEQLGRFSKDLKWLTDGNLSEVVLEEEPI